MKEYCKELTDYWSIYYHLNYVEYMYRIQLRIFFCTKPVIDFMFVWPDASIEAFHYPIFHHTETRTYHR